MVYVLTMARSSKFDCIISIVKCSVGIGSFVLPYTFSQIGVVPSVLLTCLVAIVTVYTLVLLTECEKLVKNRAYSELSVTINTMLSVDSDSDVENTDNNLSDGSSNDMSFYDNSKRELDVKNLSYADIGFYAFKNNKYISAFIDFIVVATSLGVCIVYMEVMTSMTHQLLQWWGVGMSLRAVHSIFFPVLFVLALCNDFRGLKFTTITGTVAILGGLVSVCIFGLACNRSGRVQLKSHDPWEVLSTNLFYNSPSELLSATPRCLSDIFFLYAIHVVLLPIVQSLKLKRGSVSMGSFGINSGGEEDEEEEGIDDYVVDEGRGKDSCFLFSLGSKRGNFCIVIAFLVITCVNIAFGVVAFLLYDNFEHLSQNILNDIDSSVYMNVVKLLIVLDLLFSIPLVLAASRILLEDKWVAALLALASRRDEGGVFSADSRDNLKL